MGLWALTGEILIEVAGHIFIVCSVDSHAYKIIVNDSENYFNLGGWSL